MDFFNYDYNPNLRFDMFTEMHFVQVLMFTTIFIIFFLVKDRVYNSKYEKQIRYALAGVLIVNEIVLYTIELSAGKPYLPFHLCAISYLLTIVLLITNNEKIFNFIFFTGILGGLVSIAFPDFGNGGYDRYRFYEFIIAHSAIVYVPIYYLTNYKYKITFKKMKNAFIIANTLAFSMMGINYLLRITNFDPEANYMFTMGPPPETQAIFGTFPWHILSFEAFLIVTIFILYKIGEWYSNKEIKNS